MLGPSVCVCILPTATLKSSRDLKARGDKTMSGIDLGLWVRVKNDHLGSECGGMFLYKIVLLLCDVLAGML